MTLCRKMQSLLERRAKYGFEILMVRQINADSKTSGNDLQSREELKKARVEDPELRSLMELMQTTKDLNQALYLQENTRSGLQGIQDICSWDPGFGDCCEEQTQKFHYDPSLRICYSFRYRGCGGNNNTFDTMEECETTCAGDQHGNCLLDVDFGGCCNQMIKFYYNRFTGECHEFIYNGCAGNRNTFDTREECETFCAGNAINKAEHCNEASDRGRCPGLIYRFYYNSTLNDCRGFAYGGCGGNANNFPTRQDCIRVCINSM